VPKFKLAGVLRARQARENAAKAAAAAARNDARVAVVEAECQSAALDAAHAVDPGTAKALAASMIAQRMLASALSVAIESVRAADTVVDERVDELALATAQRKAMDKLAERHALSRRRAAEAHEAREVDDLVAARHGGGDGDVA
jgi:flagellar export protein FliJ